MTDYKVVNATDEQLDEFYDDWDLTIEGLSTKKDSLDQYYEVLTDLTPVKEQLVFYIVTGKQMNEKYHLTDSNAYPDTTHIVVCKNKAFKDLNKIVIPRFAWGGRWFTDIVDNNARRQEEMA